MRWKWFTPERPDLIGLLIRQGDITVAGIEAFDRWSSGDDTAGQRVRDLEHQADDARRAVVSALRRAFTTPVEPEDLYELSERLDGVMNRAKDLVREAEVLGMGPDAPMAEMSHLVLQGVRELTGAIPHLGAAPDKATEAADRAIRQQRAIERVYRKAMSALLDAGDIREVGGRRELYRRFARMGDAVEEVADRIWYAVVKQA